MATNVMDALHKKVLRKFHTLCSVLCMSTEDKETLIGSYGVESSADINTHDLIDLCNKLARQADTGYAKMNTLRKRLMAAIGEYLTAMDKESNAEIIKAIACRASGYTDFNKIPEDRLRSLYNAFLKYRKDLNQLADFTKNIMLNLKPIN